MPPTPRDRRTAMLLASWMSIGIWWALRTNEAAVLALAGVTGLTWWVGRHRETARWGLANGITAARVVLAASIALLPREALVPWGGWLLLLFFTLDGVDGWWARRTKTASSFGAAFDQEADAFVVAVVSLRLALGELVPTWVVVVGALRYGYVLVVHSLRTHGEAPRSLIARYAFGILITTFIAVMLHPSPLTRMAAIASSLLIVASFARSLWWSWRGAVPNR